MFSLQKVEHRTDGGQWLGLFSLLNDLTILAESAWKSSFATNRGEGGFPLLVQNL